MTTPPKAWVRPAHRTKHLHPSRRRWEVSYIDPLTRARRTKGGFATKAEAQAWRDDFTADTRRGEYIDPAAQTITFNELANEWHRNTQAHRERARTKDDYYKIINGPKSPTNMCFGAIRLADITHERVAEYIATLAQTRAPQTVRNHYYVLRAVLGYAMRTRRILVNPADGITLPKQRKPHELEQDRYPLTQAEIQAMIAHIPTPYDTYTQVLAATGARPEEVAALTVADVDTTAGTITINKVNVEASGQLHREAYTKTSHSRRTVTLDTATLSHLCKHIEAHRARAVKWFTDHPEHEHPGDALPCWVGVQRGGNTNLPLLERLDYSQPIRPSAFTKRYWHQARQAANVPHCTPYSLRHAHASLLVDRIGQPGALTLKEVQDRLGHSSAVMTLDRYAHKGRTDHDATRSKLDAALMSDATIATVVPITRNA